MTSSFVSLQIFWKEQTFKFLINKFYNPAGENESECMYRKISQRETVKRENWK